ncbi:hypothetical protein [Streptomyces sp. NPDC049916]|uniref:hypothetical protein n=1 Tax=Streptomyces sp. NPDC049916 TaxID=3155156 RepID=UPI00342944AE
MERLRAALAQAEEDYAPVRGEINRRLTAEAEEREEQDRRREAEQAERRARQALWRDRCHELASRRVWCWVVEGGGTSVLIHRCDLPTAAQARGTVHQPVKPLTFYRLEKKLLKLGDEGGTTVRWDQACRDSVVAECSVPGGAESFEEWWAVVTSDGWLRPDTMPRRPPSGPVRGRGGHGSTATDYGSGGFNCGGGF